VAGGPRPAHLPTLRPRRDLGLPPPRPARLPHSLILPAAAQRDVRRRHTPTPSVSRGTPRADSPCACRARPPGATPTDGDLSEPVRCAAGPLRIRWRPAPAVVISCASGECVPVGGCHGESSAHSGAPAHLVAEPRWDGFGQPLVRKRRRSPDVSRRSRSGWSGTGRRVARSAGPVVRHLDGVGADDRVLGGQPATGADHGALRARLRVPLCAARDHLPHPDRSGLRRARLGMVRRRLPMGDRGHVTEHGLRRGLAPVRDDDLLSSTELARARNSTPTPPCCPSWPARWPTSSIRRGRRVGSGRPW
jgi:hypothetical protein